MLGIDSRINYAMSENAFFRWRPKQPRRVELILPSMTGLETLFNDFWFRLACYIHGDTVYVSVFQRLVTGHKCGSVEENLRAAVPQQIQKV